MKKKTPLPLFEEAALPLIPIFPELVTGGSALVAALSAAAAYLISVLVLKLFAAAFPKRAYAFVFVLTACCALYAASLFYPLPSAAAALSACLLGFSLNENKRKKSEDPNAAFLKTCAFLLIALYLGFAQEALGSSQRLPLFQRVPGTLLLLFVPAVFWPVRRRVRARPDRLHEEALR